MRGHSTYKGIATWENTTCPGDRERFWVTDSELGVERRLGKKSRNSKRKGWGSGQSQL